MELNKTQVEEIKQLKQGIVSSGTISKKQVLGLEEVVGYNIITQHHNINAFTEMPTRCLAEEVSNTLSVALNNIKITNMKTSNGYRVVLKDIAQYLNETREYLANIVGISNDVLTRLTDTKYTSWYDKAILIDIAKDKPVQEVFMWNSQYMMDLITLAGGGAREYDWMTDELNNFADKNNGMLYTDAPLSYITMLLDDKPLMSKYSYPTMPFIKTVTLEDIKALINKAPRLIIEIDAVLESIKDDIKCSTYMGAVGYVKDEFSYTEVRHDNAIRFKSILEDPASITTLSVLGYLNSKKKLDRG